MALQPLFISGWEQLSAYRSNERFGVKEKNEATPNPSRTRGGSLCYAI